MDCKWKLARIPSPSFPTCPTGSGGRLPCLDFSGSGRRRCLKIWSPGAQSGQVIRNSHQVSNCTVQHCTAQRKNDKVMSTKHITPLHERPGDPMTFKFIWKTFGTIPTNLEIYAPLPLLHSLLLCRNLDPNMYVSKNDHQDSFTGHTTFSARPSDIFGDLWCQQMCTWDYVILNWVTEDDSASSDIWNLKITRPHRRRHHVTIFDRDCTVHQMTTEHQL